MNPTVSDVGMTQACEKCSAVLQVHWLKNGICRGCQYPKLIVEAVYKKTVMKDRSKRAAMRYVVWSSQPTNDNPFGRALSWHPSLKAALLAHPDAVAARGCTQADGSFRVLK